MSTRIQIRRDTSENWESVNPVLADGEISYDKDAKKIKIGDGVSHWLDLPYNEGDFIPIAGTEDNKPVTGPVKMVIGEEADLEINAKISEGRDDPGVPVGIRSNNDFSDSVPEDKKIYAQRSYVDGKLSAYATTAQLTTEATTRGNADTTLQSEIDTETVNRALADNALQSQITTEKNRNDTQDVAIAAINGRTSSVVDKFLHHWDATAGKWISSGVEFLGNAILKLKIIALSGYTIAQKNAIVSPTEGMLIYQSDTPKGLQIYRNGMWSPASNGANSSTELITNAWNLNLDGYKKFKTINSDTTITLTIYDGEEGMLLINGNGYNVTIANKVIPTHTTEKTLIGVAKIGNIVFVVSQFITQYLIASDPGTIITKNVIYAGANLINSSNIWTSNKVENGYTTIGIDNSSVIPANTAVRLWMQYKSGDVNAIIGFDEGNVAVIYQNMKVGFWVNDSGFGKNENGTISGMTGVTRILDKFYGIYRDTSGTFYFQESADEINWVTRYTFSTVYAGQIMPVCAFGGTTTVGGVGKLSYPKISY